MASDSKDLAQKAEDTMNAEINRTREPAQPQAAPWKPITGVRSDGGNAARRTIGGAKE